MANNINAGTINANGGASPASAQAAAGTGGGGAGGSIRLEGNVITLGSNVTATGGVANTGSVYYGGNGGVGRIALQYVTSYSGTTNPSADVSQPPSIYYPTATIQSTNLLNGQYAGKIESVTYNLSSKPSGSTATIQFSQDASNWYNSSGTLNGTNTLTTGLNNNINLLTRNWSGPNFYYKIAFGSDGTVTPVLDDLTVNYVGGVSYAASGASSISITTDSYLYGIKDGADQSRIVDGCDVGLFTTNTCPVTVSNGAVLTINSNETVAAGYFSVATGSAIVVAPGGAFKPNGILYALDADHDRWPTNISSMFIYGKGSATPSGMTRRDYLLSFSTADCDDTTASAGNTCGVGIGQPCTSDAGCTTGLYCGTDADADQLFSAALGHTGVCFDTAYPYTDVDDSTYCPNSSYDPPGTCAKCVNGGVTYQTSSEDLFSECDTSNCRTGNCSGSGYLCATSGTWTCDQCNASCCSIDPTSHCTHTTCGDHICSHNCAANGGPNYCSGFDVSCCHFEPDLNCNPQPCNCRCQ
jgi:hypothetical protein